MTSAANVLVGRSHGLAAGPLRYSPQLDEGFYEALAGRGALESKRVAGGTSLAALDGQIAHARETLAAVQARVSEERA